MPMRIRGTRPQPRQRSADDRSQTLGSGAGGPTTARRSRHRSWTFLGIIAAFGCGSSGVSSGDASIADTAPSDGDGFPADAISTTDAFTGSFGCAGSADPATAPATLVVSGQITVTQADDSSAAVPNLNVSLVRLPNTSLAAGVTDAAGNYSLSYSSGGNPVEARESVNAPAQAMGARIFFGRPLFEDRVFDVALFSTLKFDKNYTDAGVTRVGGTAYALVTVRDCDGVPVVGATVTSSAPATIRYDDTSGLPSATATSTASDGRAHLLNLTSGNTTIAATKGPVTFRMRAISAFSGEVTLVELVP